MARSIDRDHHLAVRGNGSLEIPSELLSRAGLGAGDKVVLRVQGNAIEIVPTESTDEQSAQFVAWRDISHSLLTGGR